MRKLCRFISPLLLFLLPATAPAQQTKAASQQTADTVASTIAQLRQIPVQDADDLPYGVPEPVRPLLTKLKHQLRTLIADAVLTSDGDPTKLKQNILGKLSASSVRVEGQITEPASRCKEQTPFTYGGIDRIDFWRPLQNPKLLAVTTRLLIGCGTDSSLYLFDQAGGEWKLAIAVESNGYAEVKGAFGAFEFGVAPPDARGNWYVVTASVTPWCTSNWHGLRFSALRPGGSPESPNVIYAEETGVYIGDDEPFRLKVAKSGFSIDHVNWFHLDSGRHSRIHLRRFRVNGSDVKRTPPYALAPDEFVDEWTRMDWKEASRHSAHDESSAQWHARLKSDGSAFQDFQFVQPCKGKSGERRWVMGLGGELNEPPRVYFDVRESKGNYFIHTIGSTRPAGCPGNTPPLAGSDKIP